MEPTFTQSTIEVFPYADLHRLTYEIETATPRKEWHTLPMSLGEKTDETLAEVTRILQESTSPRKIFSTVTCDITALYFLSMATFYPSMSSALETIASTIKSGTHNDLFYARSILKEQAWLYDERKRSGKLLEAKPSWLAIELDRTPEREFYLGERMKDRRHHTTVKANWNTAPYFFI